MAGGAPALQTLEDWAQKCVGAIAYSWRRAFRRSADAQDFDLVPPNPFLNLLLCIRICYVAGPQRPPIALCALPRPLRPRVAFSLPCSSVAMRRFPHSEDKHPIRIPNIPFRPLRPRHVRRIRASLLFRLFQRKLRWNQSFLRLPSRRAPPTDLQPSVPGRPQCRLVDTRLPAGDDFSKPPHRQSW
jgi:hypothetical protein